MSLNLDREREKQLQLKSRGQGKYWRPQDGQNVIRVLTFKHKVTKQDVEEKLYSKSDLGKTFEEWCYPVVMHFGLNPENRKAPVKSSPEIMELYEKLQGSGNPDEQAKALRIRPVRKYAMNILDLNDPEKGVQIYLAAKSVREFIGEHLIDPDFGEAILGPKGRDIKIKFDSKSQDAKSYYKIFLQDKEKCRPINSKIADKTLDLYSPQISAEFVQPKEFSSLDTGDESPPEKAEEAEPKGNGKKDPIFDD